MKITWPARAHSSKTAPVYSYGHAAPGVGRHDTQSGHLDPNRNTSLHPTALRRLFRRRASKIPTDPLRAEDEGLVREISLFLEGPNSETDAALAAARRHSSATPQVDGASDIKKQTQRLLLSRKRRARRERTLRPAALRQVSLVDPDSVFHTRTTMNHIMQITPIRRHASSSFEYASVLREYGVSEEDWKLFTQQFERSNWLTLKQLAFMTAWALLTEGWVFFTQPAQSLTLGGLLNIPLYFHFKRKNLRRNVYNGTIPAWTAYWNKTFFGPKGLVVGFDLPGPVFLHASVNPKPRLLPLMRIIKGRYATKEMSARRAAKRARITMIRLHDPVPDNGRRPYLEPVEVAQIQLCE